MSIWFCSERAEHTSRLEGRQRLNTHYGRGCSQGWYVIVADLYPALSWLANGAVFKHEQVENVAIASQLSRFHVLKL